jgi:Pilus formation protein N terminal region
VRARNIHLPQRAIVSLILLTICASMARADETVEVSPGFMKLLRFDRPVGTVAVGNPGVADTFAPNDRAILLTGKTVGRTNLIILDAGGSDLFSAEVVVSRGEELGNRVTIHSRPLLHSYYEYHCSPVCVLMGSIIPPRIYPTMRAGSAIPPPSEITTEPTERPVPPAGSTPPPTERQAPAPER